MRDTLMCWGVVVALMGAPASVGGQPPVEASEVLRVELSATCSEAELRAEGHSVLLYLSDGAAVVAWDSGHRVRGACDAQPWTPQQAMSASLTHLLTAPSELRARERSVPLAVGLVRSTDRTEVIRRLSRLGVEVQWVETSGRLAEIGLLVGPKLLGAVADELTSWSGLVWADVLGGARLFNSSSAWHCQSGEPGATPVFAAGLRGQGQIVGIMDTGIDIDMCFFADSDLGDPPSNGDSGTDTDPAQRKVVAVDFYWDQDWPSPGPLDWDDQGHGTHVAGSVAGDDGADGVHSGNDGMAPAAQLVIQDGGYQTNDCADLPGLGCPLQSLAPVLQQAYDQGARLHSNSWGDEENIAPYNRYTERSADVDRFMWHNPEMLVLFAAGNSGPSLDTVSSPSTAKNAVSVGAGDHGDEDPACLAYFSSRGWTHDGRIKPDVVAPGSSVISANSDGDVASDNCGVTTKSGTSMACPTAAGLGALARQYLTDGLHPLLAADPRFGFEPSGALVKALLIASARDIHDECSSVDPVPSRDQGWGRIQLDRALAFPGSGHRLLLQERPAAFSAGSDPADVTQIEVATSGRLKVVLVWTDPPSTSVASTNLINDLDLTVTGPDGTFVGNAFADGVSVAGGAADRLNNVEVVLLPDATAGSWTVSVTPHAVPVAPQGYALVAVGSVAGCDPAGEPSGVQVTDGGSGALSVSWDPGTGPFEVWRRLWGCGGGGTWEPAGTVSAGSSFLDDQLAHGATYGYTVAKPDSEGWCGHRLSTCVEGTVDGTCSLAPQFAGVGSVDRVSAAACGLTVSWSPASGSCTSDVLYNVYRSTGPDVTADTAHRVATGVSGTEWVDTHVHEGMQYSYLVRAEDVGVAGAGPNGGAEESNPVVRSGVASGPEVVVMLDGGGDGSSALTGDAEWSYDSTVAHTGGSSWVGCQSSGICSSLTTAPLLLEGDEVLELWTRWGIEPRYDGGVVEVRPAGAAQWIQLDLVEGYPDEIRWTSTCGYPDHTPAFSSEGHLAWERYTADLQPWAGQQVEIRWTCSTDSSVIKDGWWLDDIKVSRMGPCSDSADPDCNGLLETAEDVQHLVGVLYGGAACGGEDVDGDGAVDAGDVADVVIALQ